MTNEQRNVEEFMKLMNQKVETKPTIPSDKDRILRVKLLLEEVLEFAAGSGVGVFVKESGNLSSCKDCDFKIVGDVDLENVPKELSDIDYVNQGAASTYGLDLEVFQKEVHDSNMTKPWTDKEIEDNQDRIKQENLTVIRKGNGHNLVLQPDGKAVKSPSYRKANTKRILEYQLKIKNNNNG